MTKGNVVLVPFPFDDVTTSKVHPAVCLTEPAGPHRHIVLAFIMSRIPAELLDTDLVLNSESAGFSSAGLWVSSTLPLHRLIAVTMTLLRRERGILPPDLRRDADDRLRKPFRLRG
jgi:mRNA interferase MazF